MADQHSARTQVTRLTPADQDRTMPVSASASASTPASTARPVIPDVELGEEIGRGGMGVVYRGRQTYIDRRVAIKLLLVDRAGGDEFLKRFQREAKILAGLSHPHIVACYQAGITAEGNPFLVMEYIEGPNLRDWLNQHGAMSAPQALSLVRDLAQALEHANSQGIIHRDVKPENVLLQKRERAQPGDPFPFQVKLVDLGLARPVGTGGSTSLTMQGVVMGTPATMAPEQFEDPDHVDFKADMYGLGCVFYHAITGQPAFASPTLAQIVTAKISGPVPDPSRSVAGLDRSVVDLARSLLARDKAERPASYHELIERCDALLAGGAASRSSSNLLRYALAGVSLVVVAATWLAFASSAPPAASKTPTAPPSAAPVTAHPGGSAGPPAAPPVPAPAATPAPAQAAPPPPPADRPLVYDAPRSLARFSEWARSGEAQWDRSETQDDALSGVSGEISHPLEPGLWRIEATLVLGAGELKTDHAAIGVVGADGEHYEVTIDNQGKDLLLSLLTLSGQKVDEYIANDIVHAQTLHVVLRHDAAQFLEIEAGDKPLAKPIGLPGKALPFASVYLRVKNTTKTGTALTVEKPTVQYPKP